MQMNLVLMIIYTGNMQEAREELGYMKIFQIEEKRELL